jgi:hypothetical protein
MSYTNHLVESYQRRTGQPGDGHKDGVYAYQWAVLRDVLVRLEVILEDEDVPRATAERVLRCLLYGAPSAADADMRTEPHDRTAELLARIPPPLLVPPQKHASTGVLVEDADVSRGARQ